LQDCPGEQKNQIKKPVSAMQGLLPVRIPTEPLSSAVPESNGRERMKRPLFEDVPIEHLIRSIAFY
jgi:hypothetical protein